MDDEGQTRGRTLADLNPEVQQIARWVAERYEETALWPSQAQVWREIARQGLHHDVVVRGGNDVFDHLGSPPRKEDFVRLRPWVLYDTGACREAFDRAYALYQEVQARLHDDESVTVTRKELSEKYNLPFASKEIHQLVWVLSSVYGGTICDEKSTDTDWKQTFLLGYLKNPMETMEGAFLRRPSIYFPSATPARPPAIPDKPVVKSVDQSPLVAPAAKPDPRKVFVIHGRNTRARDEMEHYLRSLGLDPLRFGDVRASLGGTPTVADVVERGMEQAQGVVALFTADEYAAVRPEYRESKDKREERCRWQARPNVIFEAVIFEAGMAFGRDRHKVVFVLLGDPALCSDLAGIHVLTPTNDPGPNGHRAVLRQTLVGMGCRVDGDCEGWMTEGDFESCILPLASDDVHDPFGKTDGAQGKHGQSGSTDDRAPRLTAAARQLFRRIGQSYVEAGYPRHTTLTFSLEAGQESAFSELNPCARLSGNSSCLRDPDMISWAHG
jgi:predicted nucleotide-binding protein